MQTTRRAQPAPESVSLSIRLELQDLQDKLNQRLLEKGDTREDAEQVALALEDYDAALEAVTRADARLMAIGSGGRA